MKSIGKKLVELVFSVRNSANKKHRIVTFLGMKAKFQREKKVKLKKEEKLEIKKDECIFQAKKIKYKKNKKIKIYFLFHSKAFWPSWESFYNSCKQDENIEIKFIFCPVKQQGKGYNGQFADAEDWLKSQEIEYVHIRDFEMNVDVPHVLIIQTPYDVWHRLPQYYSSEFKRLGNRNVYISYGLEFTESDNSIKNHFQLNVHKNSWRIYTFCKNLIRDYKKYCPIGNKHVRCLGHPKFDALYNARSLQIPDNLKRKINGRKIILWHPHFPCDYSLENGKKVLSTFSWENNLEILKLIKKNKDLFFVFMPHHMFFGVWSTTYKVDALEVQNFEKQLVNGENSTVWYDDYPPVLFWVDAIMGERSAVTMEATVSLKPVLYLEQVPEVYNKFGIDVVNSYYYADKIEDVANFIENVKKGYDPKKELRQRVFTRYFRPYFDGKCGERIKKDIVEIVKREK